MIDVNAEAKKTLSALNCKITYYYPENFNKLPIVSFYNLTEKPDFSCDNEEAIQGGTVIIDIWADKPSECGEIGIKVNKIMTADNWNREFSMDIKPEGGVYHRTMRFSKFFVLNEEE